MTVTCPRRSAARAGGARPAGVRGHLIDAARPFIFDTGLAPAAVGSACAALRVLITEPWRAQDVLRYAAELAPMCDVPAARIGRGVGDPRRARGGAGRRDRMPRSGRAGGLLRPPTVPTGTSRLRLTARASLSEDELTLARRCSRKCCRGLERSRRHRHRHRRRQDGGHRGAGMPCAAGGNRRGRCKPVQTGSADGDDDLAESGRLSGVSRDCRSLASATRTVDTIRRRRAGRVRLPTRGVGSMVIGVDRPGRLTLVEGAGACSSRSVRRG